MIHIVRHIADVDKMVDRDHPRVENRSHQYGKDEQKKKPVKCLFAKGAGCRQKKGQQQQRELGAQILKGIVEIGGPKQANQVQQHDRSENQGRPVVEKAPESPADS